MPLEYSKTLENLRDMLQYHGTLITNQTLLNLLRNNMDFYGLDNTIRYRLSKSLERHLNLNKSIPEAIDNWYNENLEK